MKKSTLLFAAIASGALLTACGSKSDTSSFADDKIIAGDTLFTSAYLTVARAYAVDDDGEPVTLVVRSTPSRNDTTEIDGVYTEIMADASTLTLTLGVDTARYDLASLPAEIEPIDQFALAEVVKADEDEKVVTDREGVTGYYDVTIYMRRHPKLDVTNFITASLQTSFDNLFLSETFDRVTPEMDVKQAADFLADQFKKGYRELVNDGNITTPYAYEAYYYPNYQSADGRLITFYLYNQVYTGGAHGADNATYVTFDARAGKALGIEDIFTPAGFDKAASLLAEKVSQATSGAVTTAYVENLASQYPAYYINYKGHLYPRPALTRDGVVFAYQPYDISSYADGVRFFLLPYSALTGTLRPEVLK